MENYGREGHWNSNISVEQSTLGISYTVSWTEGRGNVMKKTRPVSGFYDVISVMNNLPATREIA